MPAQDAAATGTLGGTPITNLLIYVLDRRLTGTLVIEDHRYRKSAVAFRSGAPIKVKIPEETLYLSELLVAEKLIDQETARRTYEIAAARGEPHGKVLLGEKLVDPASLDDALGEQICRKVEWLCALRPESMFGYYEGEDFLRAYGTPEGAFVEPLSVVWRALQKQADATVIDATLGKFAGRELRLHPNSRVGRFGFDAKERGALDVLRARPQPLAGLLGLELLPVQQLKRVLFVLAATRHLDVGLPSGPVGVGASSVNPATQAGSAPENVTKPLPSVRPKSPPVQARVEPAVAKAPSPQATKAPSPQPAKSAPQHGSAEIEAFRAEIRAKGERIGSENYYEILGVPRDAPTTAIQGAFFGLAKRWHPDRLPAELADVRDIALRVFGRMSEANQVLTSDEQRQDYERLMEEGGASADEQEEVQRILRAATSFQKAEVLVRRGNLEEAEKHAQAAAEGDPDQPEYVALYADLLSQRPGRTEAGFGDLLRMVNDARKAQPDNKRVRMYRARVLKRSGDVEGAAREFRAIAEQDPNNVEAAREVRLFEMRRGKISSDPRKTNPKRPDAADGKKTDPNRGGSQEKGKGTGLNQDIGQLFGKFFKR